MVIPFLTAPKNIVTGIVIASYLALVSFCVLQYTQKEATKLELQSVKNSYLKEAQTNNLKMIDLQKQLQASTLAHATEVEKIDRVHKEQIRDIEAKYRGAINESNSLRNTVAKLNTKLTTATRAAVETYAATAANNLAECTSTTVELEQYAYQLNAELETTRQKWAVFTNEGKNKK